MFFKVLLFSFHNGIFSVIPFYLAVSEQSVSVLKIDLCTGSFNQFLLIKG